MAKLDFLPSFERDLEEIWLYVAIDNMLAADRLIGKLYDRCQILEEFPEAGPGHPDMGTGYRHLVEGNYLIVYRVSGDRVELVRVFHAKRDLGSEPF